MAKAALSVLEEKFTLYLSLVCVPSLASQGWGRCFIHRLESLVSGEEETNYRSSFLACDPALPVLRERVILVETGR